MGAACGKTLKPVHKRVAGLHTADTAIEDPTEWFEAYANDEDDYNLL